MVGTSQLSKIWAYAFLFSSEWMIDVNWMKPKLSEVISDALLGRLYMTLGPIVGLFFVSCSRIGLDEGF